MSLLGTVEHHALGAQAAVSAPAFYDNRSCKELQYTAGKQTLLFIHLSVLSHGASQTPPDCKQLSRRPYRRGPRLDATGSWPQEMHERDVCCATQAAEMTAASYLVSIYVSRVSAIPCVFLSPHFSSILLKFDC